MKKLSVLLLSAACLFAACSKSSKSTNTSTTWTCNNHLLYKDSSVMVTFPTAFTPNGDGKNDLFRVIATGISDTSYHLSVYKPNGQLIYQTSTQSQGWDGRDSSGNLATDYKFGISVKFTNIHGQTIDTCTSLFLLSTNSTTGCIIKTADSASYIFADQIDPVTGQAAYATNEVFCN